MPPAITFALISLTAAGCLEVVFKRFAMKARSRGMYIMGCGIVWLLLQLIYFNAQDLIIQLNSTTVFYGLLTGISVLLANILLIESLAKLNVSLGSMIYRLNTIGVVVLSYFFLSESLESTKLSGVLLGISAIVLLYIRENHGDETSTSHHHFLIIAIGASIFRAAYGFGSKLAINEGAQTEGLLFITAVSWIVGGLVYSTFRERCIKPTKKIIFYSLISGTLSFIIANALIEALTLGQASVVVPIANLSFGVGITIALVLGMEKLTWKKFIALIAATLSIFLLAQTS